MHIIDCPVCSKGFVVGKSAILWFANTDHGPRALVECPRGHQLIKDYRSATTTAAIGPVDLAAL